MLVGKNSYLVEQILGKRISIGRPAGDTHRKGTVLYRVKWAGLPEEESTWEPKSLIATELIAAFEAQLSEPQQQPTPAQPRSSSPLPTHKRGHEPAEKPSPSAKSPDAKRSASLDIPVEDLD